MTTHEPGDHAPRRRRRRARRKPTGRGQAANLATKVGILKAAAAAFRRRGYHGATVEQIAGALKMKKGNLYYYFRNKEELLFGCHQYSLDRLLAILDDVQRQAIAPEEKIRRLIAAFVHTILDELHGTALLLDLEALSPAHLRTTIERRDQFDGGLRQVLQEGIELGAFGIDDPKLISFAMLGAVNWIPRWYSPAGPATSDEIADQFASYLIAGLRPADRRPI